MRLCLGNYRFIIDWHSTLKSAVEKSSRKTVVSHLSQSEFSTHEWDEKTASTFFSEMWNALWKFHNRPDPRPTWEWEVKPPFIMKPTCKIPRYLPFCKTLELHFPFRYLSQSCTTWVPQGNWIKRFSWKIKFENVSRWCWPVGLQTWCITPPYMGQFLQGGKNGHLMSFFF